MNNLQGRQAIHRQLLLLSVVLSLLVLWGWLLLHRKPQPLGVPTRKNFERVQKGMTMAEVEAILGPDGARVQLSPAELISHAKIDPTAFSHRWVANDCIITIGYRGSDRPKVSFKVYHEWPPDSLRARLRRWLPW